MVKERNYYPVYFAVIPAITTVYVRNIFFEIPDGSLLPVFLFLLFFSLAVCLYTVYRIRRFLLAACLLFGILTGLAVSRGMMIRNQPLRTLASRNEITALSCEFLSDPVPFGTDYYKVPVCARLLHTVPDSAFSVNGTAELIFPSAYVRQSFPGFTACTTERIIPAAGLAGRFPVTMEQSVPGKRDRFQYVSGNTAVSGTTLRSRARFSLIRMLYDWREPGGLLLALLTANRDYLEPSLSQAFRDAGLSHILALSGMHLAILGGIAFGLGFVLAGRRCAILTSLILMICFVWFAGRSPSLSRALFMALGAVIMRCLGLRVQPLPVIMLACLLQLLFFGNDAWSIAFMLSYAALLGIILPGTWLVRILEPLIPAPLSSGLCVSFGAQLCTVPVVAVTFGVLSPAGILAACVISPLITLYLAGGLCIILIAVIIPGGEDMLIPVYNLLYRGIRQLVMFFASCPRIDVQDLSGAVTASILSFAVLVVLYYFYHLTCTRRAPDALFTRL